MRAQVKRGGAWNPSSAKRLADLEKRLADSVASEQKALETARRLGLRVEQLERLAAQREKEVADIIERHRVQTEQANREIACIKSRAFDALTRR